MLSRHGSVLRITGLMWGESIGQRWFPSKSAVDAEFWYFLFWVPEQAIDQTVALPVIREAWRHCQWGGGGVSRGSTAVAVHFLFLTLINCNPSMD